MDWTGWDWYLWQTYYNSTAESGANNKQPDNPLGTINNHSQKNWAPSFPWDWARKGDQPPGESKNQYGDELRWKCHKNGCLDVWSLHFDCLISLWMFDLSNRVLFHLGWVIALQSRIDGFQPKVHICASKYQRGEIWGKYEPSSNESVVLNSEPFQAFKRFDKDGDGLVTLSELMSLIKKARMKVKTLECSIKASGGREHAWAGGKSSARGGGPGGVFTTNSNSNWPSAGWLFLRIKLGQKILCW